VSARLTYNRYEYDGDYPMDNAGVRALNRDTALGEWIGSDIYVSKNIGDHLLTIGMEHRWQFTQQQRNFDVAPTPNMVLDDNHRNLVQGYYLQDEYHILHNLILNAGLRIDAYDNFGATANPRAALIWKPVDNTVLRLTYGEAFRAPNAYELYYDDQATAKGNPHLRPEKIRSAELGWDQFIGNNIQTTVAGFYTRISDLLEQTTDPAGMQVFMNKIRIESKGMEAQVEGRWENGWSGRLSYTYQDAVNLDTNQSLGNSPRTVAKASLTAPLPWLQKHYATVETLYGSSRLNGAGEPVAGAAIVNLTLLSRDLVKGLDISASVYNLFDTRYSMPAGSYQVNSLSESLRGIRQDGITFRIKATWRF
jgi:iron complex outermembrane receptor protein